MKYDRIRTGFFESRPNRFVAHVKVGESTEVCHVKNTGRCRELLIPGAKVFLQEADTPGRKTKYDLIAVEQKSGRIINLDSQIPNRVVQEWLSGGYFFHEWPGSGQKRRIGIPALIFMWKMGSAGAFLEVKGVTLDEGGTARFPDAPTLRGG